MSALIEKVTRAATDEIYGSISDFATGNYWINEYWNIFCEKGYCVIGGEVEARYYAVSLEQYDGKENCIDCQVDYQDTKDMTEIELEKAIRQIIERNEERLRKMKSSLRSKRIVGRTLIVEFDDGSVKRYDTIALGVEWFKMSNDAFYKTYGFNFTPQEAGVYEICRQLVYPSA